MDAPLPAVTKNDLRDYSQGTLSAMDLRRRLGDATFGDVLRLLGQENLPLPIASPVGREATIARARRWLFPPDER